MAIEALMPVRAAAFRNRIALETMGIEGLASMIRKPPLALGIQPEMAARFCARVLQEKGLLKCLLKVFFQPATQPAGAQQFPQPGCRSGGLRHRSPDRPDRAFHERR